MSADRPLAWTLVVCTAAAVAACSSTQDESARLARSAKRLIEARGQTVTHPNPGVRVLQTTVLHSSNGSAVVVALRNTTRRPLVSLPIEIDVSDAHGRRLFRNDASGLETSLVQVPLLEPGGPTYWVNDQVVAGNAAAAAKATVGYSSRSAPSRLPRLTLSRPTLSQDPTSGISAIGTVANRSGITQLRVTIYCVALKAGRVVAAGRAGVPVLPGGPGTKPAHFTIFFIGDPRGARLELTAPPTVLA